MEQRYVIDTNVISHLFSINKKSNSQVKFQHNRLKTI